MEKADLLTIGYVVLFLGFVSLAILVRLTQNNLNDQISDLRERVYNLEGD